MPYILIILAAATRIIPHMNNAAAITAAAIFSGFALPKKQAFLVPLAARFVTDIFLGFFAWQLMVAVYAAHILGVFLGMWVKKNNTVIPATTTGEPESIPGSQIAQATSGMTAQKWIKIIISSLGASISFFLITNFAFLYGSYQHTMSGILQSYANGLPFLRGTVVGDVGYTAGIFAIYFAASFASTRVTKYQTASI